MKRSQTLPIKELIDAFIEAKGFKKPLIESNINTTWQKLMGPTIAAKTNNVYLNNSKLYISLNSSVLRNELMMMQDQIIDRFNEELGEQVIDTVILK